jgi:hypothetical protein
MKTSSVFLLFIAITVPAMAQTGTSTPPPTSSKPILIVRASTNLDNQGQPTLDLVDLERYFVQELSWRTVAIVRPSATAKLADFPAANTYLLDLSVDALQPAVRSHWTREQQGQQDLTVFTVELSLAVKQAASGTILGQLTQTAEGSSPHRIEHWPIAEKRSVIYNAADELAGQFVDASTDGRFGQDLINSEAPVFQRALAGQGSAIAIVAAIGVGGITLLVVVLKILFAFCRWIASLFESPQMRRVYSQPVPRPGPDKATIDVWNKQVEKAVALWLETDGFSDEACRTQAESSLDETLRDAPKISEAEAKRELTAQDREEKYAQMAAHIAPRSEHSEQDLKDILWWADAWPYYVLLEARRIAEERAQ